MKAEKKPKRPNPTGRPLPSRFARTLYSASTHVSGQRIEDFYGGMYAVSQKGELRRIA